MARNKKAYETKKSKTNNPAQETINMMVVRPARIQAEDISTWREAVNSAKVGHRSKLYDLYENLLADPVLSDAVDKRVNAITNAEIAFLKDGKSVEDMEDLIDTTEFEELIREIILHKAWGKSVIDISFNPEFNVFSVPRKLIRIDKLDRPLNERRRYIVQQEHDLKGYDYSQDPYIIECGKDDDLGFIFKAAPYVIYKRGGFGDWAQFAEIFGMPFLIGKYNGHDPKNREQLFEALGRIGSNPRAAIPKETDLQVVANNNTGSNSLYKDLKDACNEEILIAILGNIMTTLDGSSRSQSEVHQETQEEVAKADRRYVQRVLNRKLLPLLLKRGYPVAGGFFSFPDQGESIGTKERLDMAIKVKNDAGVPVDDDYFYEITGIPKPATSNEQQTTSNKQQATSNQEPETTEQRAPGNEQQATVSLWQRFRRFVTGKIQLSDGYSINFDELFREALKEVYGGDSSPVNKSLFNLTNTPLQDAFTMEFDQEGEDWGKGNADFISTFRKNAAEFAGFKAHNTTKDLIEKLYNDDGTQKTFKQYKKDCLAIKEEEERHLRTQYNTAVRATRSAINYRQFLENEDIFPNLEYTESMSSHPRVDHLNYVGTILPIRHEWWKNHMPPSDWNCKCGVKPTNKPATEAPEGDFVDPVFSNNPGESGKFIVTEETNYYKNTAPKLRSTILAIAALLESLRSQLVNDNQEEEEQ